jgi:thiosulfate/3-mercaptopyruvate sulfurtransferase
MISDKSNLENLRILDSSFFLPTDIRNASLEYAKERIPYSIFFDIDNIVDKAKDLPHSLIQDETEFINWMKKLDIKTTDVIICYDRIGLFSSPRVWFNLTVYGVKNVYVLNGGYPKWVKDGYPVEKDPSNYTRSYTEDGFDYRYNPLHVVNYDEIKGKQIIDSRAKDRYLGIAPEPRPTVYQGHYKGAINICFKEFVNSAWCNKDKNEIQQLLEEKNIDLEKEVVFYCGSGVTCCINILAFAIIGKLDICRLYDGSWAELGNMTDCRNLNINI